MAIAVNTQEFLNVKNDVQSLIDTGQIKTKRDVKNFLENQNINYSKFMEVDKEYEARKAKGTLLPDTGFSMRKITGAAIGKAAEDLGDVSGDALEFIAGKEARKTVEGGIADAANYVDSLLPKAVSTALKQTFDPKVNVAEDVAAEIGAFIAPAGIFTKATKFLKPKTTVGKAAKYGAIGTASDVYTRNDEEQFTVELSKLVPESEKFIQRLAIDPEDTVAEKRLKQIIDSAVLSGIITTTSAIALPFIKRGGRSFFGRFQALRNNNITQPISNTPTARATQVRVEQIQPGIFRQRGKIEQTLGKINTKLGRVFASTASLPKPIFDSFIRKEQFVQASDALIRKEAKELDKALKNINATSDDRLAINQLLLGENIPDEIRQRLTPEIFDIVDKMKLKIDNNQLLIKDLLQLPEDSELALKLDPRTGDPYLTRSFEFTSNPKWSKDIMKAVKGELKDTEPHNANVLTIVNDARQYLARQNPDMDANQLDALIVDLIDRGKKGDNLNTLLSQILQTGTGGPAAKILKGKKNIDRPILELLGEIKDPSKNFVETMTNQNKLIAKARYLRDIKQFAEQNVGREIELGGLFPFIPKDVATILRKPEIISEAGLDVRKGLEGLEGQVSSFGSGGTAFGLNKYTTTDQFHTMLDKGIDTFGIDNPTGNAWYNLFSKPAAIGQAAETVFDHTAHLINTYGMLQQLGFNGVLYNPANFKYSKKAAYSLYQKAAQNNDEALKYLQALKNRGIIDSSVINEGFKKNLQRYGDADTWMEKNIYNPARKFSSVPSFMYGAVDDFGKIVSFEAEKAAYKKAFPNLSEQELFEKVTDIVRNTLPSYTTAAPAVRGLARMPLGTYATFPVEMVRTTKNILKQSASDIKEGITTGNKALIQIGVRRLAGIGATTAGIEYAINNQNKTMGVSEADERAINMLSPDWAKNSSKVFNQPFYEDPKTGQIMTRYVDAGMLDSMQYIKGPVRAVVGRLMAGEEVTQREIEDAFKNAEREILGPFISEKFLTAALLNAARGVDAEGNTVKGDSYGERLLLQLLDVITPGIVSNPKKWYDAVQSEKLRGVGKGQTPSGFPQRANDLLLFNLFGIRNNTLDLDKSVGFSLYQDQEDINKSKNEFKQYLKSIGDKPLTESDIKNIYNTYIDLQIEKRKAMRRLSDKIDIFRNVEFYSKGKDGKMYKERYGIERIINAATSKGKYKVNQNLLNAASQGKRGQGIFIPDTLSEKEIIGLLQDRKFAPEVINGLRRIEQEFYGQPLKRIEEE